MNGWNQRSSSDLDLSGIGEWAFCDSLCLRCTAA